MSDKAKDGGPAFPTESTAHRAYGLAGMSLRDWFAGMAMQGMLANPEDATPAAETWDGSKATEGH